MANIDMKTLTIGENTYIVIDAGARTLIGDLSNLDTTAKNNLVAAINEAFNSGGSSITVDSALSSSSENPVQNKVINSALNLKAPLASPTFTGTPKATTPITSDNSTRIATTAYVKQNIPSVPSAYTSDPAMDGVASAGSSSSYAKGDHVHPSDTTKADKVTVTTVSDAGAVSQALDAGKIYDFTGALTSLTITLNAATAPAQYHFRFDSGSTAVSLTLPQTVTMPSGFQVEANKHYEIDILDGYGAAQSW